MKFLVIWEEHFHYINSICHALKINGHEAEPFIFRRFNSKKDVSLFKRIKYTLGLEQKEDYRLSYYKAQRDRLISKIKEYEPTVVIILNGNYLYITDEKFFSILKSKNITSVLWFLDGVPENNCVHNKDEFIDQHYLSIVDKVYVFEHRDIENLKQEYNINAKHLYIGAADEIYNFQKDGKQKHYDISFVGGAEPKRLDILNKVAKYCKENNRKINIQGLFAYNRNIKTLRKIRMQRQYSYLKPYINVGRVQPKDLVDLYKSTKINLNIVTARHNSVNPRTFEIMATKGFQLVDYNKEYERIFIDKENIVMYKNTDELLELIDFYLNNEQERLLIAENGYKLVQEKYLLKDIVKTILADLK